MKLNPRNLDDRLVQLRLDAKGKKLLKHALLVKQGYKCPICGKDLKNASPKDIQLDHSHKPPFEIRGVLCSFCNRYIITKMNEGRPELFSNAYKYLTEDKKYIEKLIERYHY
jgi:DNA-directed RNA polymerase subunit RPC12/RpoP